MLHTFVGKIRKFDGTIYVVTDEGETGCVVYGPYRTLKPGSYEVEFFAMPQDINNRTCCVFDILRRGKSIVTEKDFTAAELIHRKGIVHIRFEVVRKDIYEFRVMATGGAALQVRYQRPFRLLAPLEPEDLQEDS